MSIFGSNFSSKGTVRMKKYLAHCMPITLALLLAACGGGGGSDDPEAASIAPPAQPPVDGSNPPIPRTINGKLVMPNGNTPLSNGLVYLPKDANAAKTIISQKMRHKPVEAASVADGGCGTAPVPVIAQACTRSDGSFTLEATLPAAGFPLIAHKGVFTTQAQLTVGSDSTVVMEPVKIDVGNVKMAVVSGQFDHLEWVLTDIGFAENEAGKLLKHGTQKFDLYKGDFIGFIDAPKYIDPYPAAKQLFVPRSDGSLPINDYDIVFINCGVDETDYMPPSTEVASALRNYVNQGGRLYVTDESYDYVEQSFPEYIDFYGSDAANEDDAEGVDAAEHGNALDQTNATFAATPMASNLKAYLAGMDCGDIPCINPDGTVHIEGFLREWAVMNGAHPAHSTDVDFLMEGPVSVDRVPVTKPLAASFRFGQGMVLYSSYHTHDSFKTGPQDWILQYLVFELQ